MRMGCNVVVLVSLLLVMCGGVVFADESDLIWSTATSVGRVLAADASGVALNTSAYSLGRLDSNGLQVSGAYPSAYPVEPVYTLVPGCDPGYVYALTNWGSYHDGYFMAVRKISENPSQFPNEWSARRTYINANGRGLAVDAAGCAYVVYGLNPQKRTLC